MLNLKHLYYFHVFAQELSTTEAAKRLSISVPALSNQLKELETFLGFPLTKRLHGKVVITENGKMVAFYTELMFSAYEELKSRVSASEKVGTSFKIGISNALGVQFAFDLILLVVKSKFLDLESTVISFELAEKLQLGFIEGKYDLIIGAFVFTPKEESGWFTQKLGFPVRLFVPAALASAISENGEATDFLNHDLVIEQANKLKIALILPERGSVLRDETDQFLLNVKVRPEKTIECNNSAAFVQYILRGLGIGLAPTPSLLDFNSAKPLVVFGPPGGYWNHEISVVSRKDGEKSIKIVSPLADIFYPKSQLL